MTACYLVVLILLAFHLVWDGKVKELSTLYLQFHFAPFEQYAEMSSSRVTWSLSFSSSEEDARKTFVVLITLCSIINSASYLV